MILHVVNPLNSAIDAAIVKCNFRGKIGFTMNDQFTLISSFTELDLDPKDPEIYFRSDTARDRDIQQFVQVVKNQMLKNINENLG
mmetsp:Transcript_35941/g.26699  ORF Transcript_35941/g.26699 Transcript_35941/m.26699 type:complete len:85 (-) Transcript_35941:185-439(-)